MNNKSRNIFIAITVIPSFILVLIALILPTAKMLYTSFFDATALSTDPKFIGLDNYKYMFTDDNFITSIKNTFLLMLVVPAITLFLSVMFAVLVTQGKFREKSLYRIMFFFPSIISIVIVGILWSFIFHPNIGVINVMLEYIGLGNLARPWLGDEQTALWTVATTMVWQAAGYYMVMYIAGLDRIPIELYESATLDGAGDVRKFTAITIPFLWEIVRVTIILIISGTLNISFIITSVMTGGGPGNSTMVIFGYMYKQAFSNANFGYAMAITVVGLIIALGLSFISKKLTERETLEF